MIYGKRLGSLGNQMHIVAATYVAALDNKTDWAVSLETNEGYRGLIARSSFNNTFFRNIPKKRVTTGKSYSEGSFRYKKIPNDKNLILQGYFQSEKYYGHRRREVLELFNEYHTAVADKVDHWFAGLDRNKTISLHIRRTDYVKLSTVHVVQPIEYYDAALHEIARQLEISLDSLLSDYTLMIFSDDLAWCKEHEYFRTKPHVRFIENNHGQELNAVIDLYVMSMCQHNIIANSSFSWWAAYMNENIDKIVVAPKKWFGPRGPPRWDDIYFQGMTIL